MKPGSGEIRKVLVVKPSALGDIVHSLPFLAALRRRFKDALIHWVVALPFAGLLEGHPMVDRLWVVNKDLWKRLSRSGETVREIRALLSGLRKERFDLAVDLQGLLRSGVMTGASRAPVRVGFSEAREGSRLFYTHRVKGGRDVHAVDRYLKVAAFLGCDTTEVSFPLPSAPEAREIFPELPPRYAVIAPGAGKAANRWPEERFGELAARLSIPSVVISGRSDAALAGRVAAASGGKALSLAGRTGIRELIAVIKGAGYFISNDTGPMHIAAALGVPVFAIFGPANPVRTGPYGEGHTVFREELECSPCYARKPCKEDLRCLRAITVERVLGEIRAKQG
ncbi:MAG: lipopolysaccharide heptosyltransferase I [Thermodesulfovibrionales bacterium]